jgi:hypothetical protein
MGNISIGRKILSTIGISLSCGPMKCLKYHWEARSCGGIVNQQRANLLRLQNCCFFRRIDDRRRDYLPLAGRSVGPLPHLNSALGLPIKSVVVKEFLRTIRQFGLPRTHTLRFRSRESLGLSQIKYLTLLGAHPQISFVDNQIFSQRSSQASDYPASSQPGP